MMDRFKKMVGDGGAKVHEPEIVPLDHPDFGKCVHELFEEQALKTPDLAAVVDGPTVYTYKQLSESVDILARYLHANGSGVGSYVGIYMERSAAYVVALLAILKAGASYFPIELAYPEPLRDRLLEDVKNCRSEERRDTPTMVLTKSAYGASLPMGVCDVFCMDNNWENLLKRQGEHFLKTDLLPRPTSESSCYVVYSGGSTGRPKGIEAPHRSPVHSYLWRLAVSGYQPGSRVGCNVFFVWECLRPLIRGGACYVVPDDIIFDSVAVLEFIQKHELTEILFTPSLMETILNTAGEEASEKLKSLQSVWLAVWLNGEVVTSKLFENLRTFCPHITVHNCYSISECGEVAAINLSQEYAQSVAPKFCAVGRPATFAKMSIRDEDGATEVSEGELWIGGPGVGFGYLHRPDLNAERFVGPDENGTTWYRTGDVARLLENNILEILGRCDFMVKVRGYSVVLGAVETAVLAAVAVDSCVVIADGEEGTDKRLVAYMVQAESSQGASSQSSDNRLNNFSIDEHGLSPELYRALRKELPYYAVPTCYVLLDALPLIKASAKVDRKALPAPPPPPTAVQLPHGFTIEVDKHKSNCDDVAAQIALIFAEILQLPEGSVCVTDNFFELGGHSLAASRFVARLAKVANVTLPVSHFLKSPRPVDVALILTNGMEAATPMKKTKKLTSEPANYYTPTDMDLQLRAFWRYIVFTHQSNRVLLTGATGYLGAFLLRDLILHSDSFVYCLVRPPRGETESGPEACFARILENLEKYGIVSETAEGKHFRELLDSRMQVIAGDVGVSRLGCSEEDYHFLSLNIDVVIHSAAMVNLIYPYEALVSPNVRGTANVVQFSQEGKVKMLHYISTNGVFPEVLPKRFYQENGDMQLIAEELESGYSQSKWVAEQIVFKARDHGLPCAVYRCGNLGGPIYEDRGPFQPGCWNASDSNLHFVQACLRVSAVPLLSSLGKQVKANEELAMELTPVDFTSGIVVQCVQDIKFATGRVFHMIAPQSMDLRSLLSCGQSVGYDLRPVSEEEWIKLHEKDLEEHPASSLQPFDKEAIEALFKALHSYERSSVDELLERIPDDDDGNNNNISLPRQYPALTERQFRSYLKQLPLAGNIPKPPEAVRRLPLHGQVVLVAGSGAIASTVARDLVESGARVAVANPNDHNTGSAAHKPSSSAGSANLQDGGELLEMRGATIAEVVSEAGKRWGRPIWGFVNCMGVMKTTSAEEPKQLGEWEGMVDANCNDLMRAIACITPGMRFQRRGHIVHIGSAAARSVPENFAVYSATQHFCRAFLNGLRQNLSQYNVKVTTIQPGDISTELFLRHGNQVHNNLTALSPDGVVLPPEDVSQAVLYALAQPQRTAVQDLVLAPANATSYDADRSPVAGLTPVATRSRASLSLQPFMQTP